VSAPFENGPPAALHGLAERRESRRALILATMPVGELVRASDIASSVQISERSVYRHIAALKACGVPIMGQTGVGYMRRCVR
jgi:predicted DNA-binding transcriptional regulator YafY